MISRRFFPNDRGHAYRFLDSPTALLTLFPLDSGAAEDFSSALAAVAGAEEAEVGLAVAQAVAQAVGLAPGLAAEGLAVAD